MIKNTFYIITGIIIGWFIRSFYVDDTSLLVKSRQPAERVQKVVESAYIEPLTNDTLKSGIKNNELETLKKSLKKRDYDKSFEIIEKFYQKNNTKMLGTAIQLVISAARKMLEKRNYDEAISLLKRYLILENRNIKVRMTLVEAYRYATNYLRAVDEAYIAKGHASTQSEVDEINKIIRSLVEKQGSVYEQNKDYSAALRYYEQLVQQEANYAPYFIGLAKAQIKLGEFEDAKESLQIIVGDRNVGYQAKALLETIRQYQNRETVADDSEENETDGVSTISLTNIGSHYYLDAYLNVNDSVKLLIDTGASLTIFTPRVLNKYKPYLTRTDETRFFNTANGRVQANIYVLKELMIGDVSVSDIEVAVMEMKNGADAEGLLGMNFLKYFRFYIDQDKSALFLSLRN